MYFDPEQCFVCKKLMKCFRVVCTICNIGVCKECFDTLKSSNPYDNQVHKALKWQAESLGFCDCKLSVDLV